MKKKLMILSGLLLLASSAQVFSAPLWRPFPGQKPDKQQVVSVWMVNGDIVQGVYDGVTWWIGAADSVDDIPLNTSYVVKWSWNTVDGSHPAVDSVSK